MMALKKILNFIKPLQVMGSVDRFVRDIQYDSRKVAPEHAFIAMRGFRTDGHHFVEQAYHNGARVFFVEDDLRFSDATVVKVRDTRKAAPHIARIFFNFPDQKIKIIGITGTTGKTTTAYLLHSILKNAHWKPGLISTIEYFDGEQFRPAERTTPEALDLWRYFYGMVRAGLKSVVMEVSSHALSLHRVDQIPFVGGIFTNMGRDHLDFHGTMENYFQAKQKLFEGWSENQKVVLNEDDPFSQRIRQVTGGEIFTYSFHNPRATVSYLSHRANRDGLQIKLKVPSGDLLIHSYLLGNFNIYNIMAAVTAAVSLGLQDNFIIDGIRNLSRIPGRSESYFLPNGGTVYLDYAHTPEGLRHILSAVWEARPNNLIVVFGAGGQRDRGKRPEMGRAAEDFADQIILTNDNPRSENPGSIIDEILQGIFDKKKVNVIPDRREAILTALNAAGRRDGVVVAGKGHEKFQEIGGEKIPFNDFQVIQDYINEKNRS